MPKALKTFCLLHFLGWKISLFSLLALWGNKNWPPSMKVKNTENFQNKCDLMGCLWSSLNAPSTGNPRYHPIWKLGEFLFLMSLLRLGVSRTFLAFSRFCKCCFSDTGHARAGVTKATKEGRPSFQKGRKLAEVSGAAWERVNKVTKRMTEWRRDWGKGESLPLTQPLSASALRMFFEWSLVFGCVILLKQWMWMSWG